MDKFGQFLQNLTSDTAQVLSDRMQVSMAAIEFEPTTDDENILTFLSVLHYPNPVLDDAERISLQDGCKHFYHELFVAMQQRAIAQVPNLLLMPAKYEEIEARIKRVSDELLTTDSVFKPYLNAEPIADSHGERFVELGIFGVILTNRPSGHSPILVIQAKVTAYKITSDGGAVPDKALLEFHS